MHFKTNSFILTLILLFNLGASDCGFETLRGHCRSNERCETRESGSSVCTCDDGFVRLNGSACEQVSCDVNVRCDKNEECGDDGKCSCLPGRTGSSCRANRCRDEIDCHALGYFYSDEPCVLLDHNSSLGGFDEAGHLSCAGELKCGEFCDVETCCRSFDDCDFLTSTNCSASHALWCSHQCDPNSPVDCAIDTEPAELQSPHPKSWTQSRILNPYCMASTTSSSLKDRLSIWYVLSLSTFLSPSHTHTHSTGTHWEDCVRVKGAPPTHSTLAKWTICHICSVTRISRWDSI